MMKRCRSYRRGWAVTRTIRCDLERGHAGRHYAAGRFLDPTAYHKWGRR